MNLSDDVKRHVLQEAALLTGLVFIGLAILPLCIYFVGRAVFGEYGDGGLSGFYGQLHRELREGEPVIWFLLLSPYLLVQVLRLTLWGFRHLGEPDTEGSPGKL